MYQSEDRTSGSSARASGSNLIICQVICTMKYKLSTCVHNRIMLDLMFFLFNHYDAVDKGLTENS